MFWFIVGAALVALAAAAVINAETIIEYLKERKKVLVENENLNRKISDNLREGNYSKVDAGLYSSSYSYSKLKGIISDNLREGNYYKVNVDLYVDDKYIETVSITGDEISDEIYVGMVLEV